MHTYRCDLRHPWHAQASRRNDATTLNYKLDSELTVTVTSLVLVELRLRLNIEYENLQLKSNSLTRTLVIAA